MSHFLTEQYANLEQHELDEWLRFDGIVVNDPHRND